MISLFIDFLASVLLETSLNKAEGLKFITVGFCRVAVVNVDDGLGRGPFSGVGKIG